MFVPLDFTTSVRATLSGIAHSTKQAAAAISDFGKTKIFRPVTHATVNGIAHTCNKIGMGSTQPVEETGVRIDRDAALRRIARPYPKDPEIEEEVLKFGVNIARLLPMRMIDRFFCDTPESENFYLEVLGLCKTDEEVRDTFFKHLDKSNLFFLTRWIAKLAYTIIFPISKRTVQDATLSIFRSLKISFENNKNDMFNKRLSHQLEQSDEILTKWFIALENIAKNKNGIELVVSSLKEELGRDIYRGEMSPKEFYSKVTKKLVDNYYVDISLGNFLYDWLMKLELPTPEVFLGNFAICFINLLIKTILFPIALALWLLLILPDYAFNRILSSLIENTMMRNDVIENLKERITEGVSTNQGLSIPVLQTMNAGLEDLYVMIEGNLFNDPNGAPLSLSHNNQLALQRNVALALRTSSLCSPVNKTVRDLQLELEEHVSKKNWIDDAFAKGIENVMVLFYQKLTDPEFLKGQCYYTIKALNDCLKAPILTAAQMDKEYLVQQNRLEGLIKKILATSVNETVEGTTQTIGLSRKDAASNLAANHVFKRIYPTVDKMVDMLSSPNFIKFNLNTALNIYLKG